MKFPRRQFHYLAAGAAAVPAVSHFANAETYPSRSVRIIVSGDADIFASLIGQWLCEKLNYNFIRYITPVAGTDREPNVMEVHPSIPAKTVPEFIAYAKANPGKINCASGGIRNSQHMSGELFKLMTGINIVHVPYRGAGPALADLHGGQVDHVRRL